MRECPKTIDFSVILPIHNESETIDELWSRLSRVGESVDGCWEFIFVDDGSRDDSLERLEALAYRDPRIRVLELSRNFGHQPALTAGLDHANGRAVIMMDADLQDTPETLPLFIEKWREGYEVVYAVRRKRKEGLLKRTAFAWFYRLQKRLSAIQMPLDAGIFSLMDRKVVNAMRSMGETNRYLSGLRAFTGFRQT